MARNWLLFGAVYGFLAVALGAFGAHALRDRLAADMLAVYRTAVEYQFYHALALIGVGLWARQNSAPSLQLAGACFAIGVLLFSGSLYALTLTGVRKLGIVTPFGGVAMLIGWGALIREALVSAAASPG